MTFSILARSADGESWGAAVASRFLAVGAAVPAARAGIGAVATQAYANVAFKPDALALLGAGNSAAETLQLLLDSDEGRDRRQVGIVDATGRAASHTGSDCSDWAGSRVGDGYAIQGNLLVGEHVVVAMERAWLESDPLAPLGRRLLDALAAGDDAGGDRRGRQSAALLLVRAQAGYGGLDDVAMDLRVDDDPHPIPELTRLLDLHELYLTPSTDQEKVPVTAVLEEEVAILAQACGYASFAAWVADENYELRVAMDGSWIDQRVLAILRAAPPLALVS